MDIILNQLSSLDSPNFRTSIDNLNVKQFKRSYVGGYKINFPICLNESYDSKTINYSNFYLSNKDFFENFFTSNKETQKSLKILTEIIYSDEYLSFSEINPIGYKLANRYSDRLKYGYSIFSKDKKDIFKITFLNLNKCNISYEKNGTDFYLVSDIDNNLFFASESELSFEQTNINPQDFIYLFSESGNDILFFKKNNTGNFILTKNKNTLKLQPNIVDYIYDPFKLSRNLYTYPYILFNNSFISYKIDGDIDMDKSKFNLKNNFLIHKTYTDKENTIGIINLKNQLSQLDIFTCSNSTLSSSNKNNLFIEDFREYTNINNNINQEKSEELTLNYVFYNKPYNIKPGSNIFYSPSSLYPFSKLNINDTKFINAGASSYNTPQYADKVYHLSNDKQSENGQYLLCTWLSGNIGSDDKIWVDRYYYPDLISKENALMATPFFNTTYDDYIEDIIANNIEYKQNISDIKFFDKKSDLVFLPNEKYRYERIKIEPISQTEIIEESCSQQLGDYPLNYFKEINEKGEFTLSFVFFGDDSIWEMKSDRNEINCGLNILKNGSNISFNYFIYNPELGKTEEFNFSSKIVEKKSNIFVFSISNISGNAYIYLNNDIVYRFSIFPYKYVRYRLLYGDIFLFLGEEKTNIVKLQTNIIKNLSIESKYTDENYSKLLPIFYGILPIEDIVITLPCGMRNSIDDISILQDICNSSSFKSNNVNIILKNIDGSDILDEQQIKNYLLDNLNPHLPANINLNSIEFKKYK